MPAAVVLGLVAAALAGGGPAMAAPRHGGPAGTGLVGPRPAGTAPAGTVSTVVGGAGGPARATRVDVAMASTDGSGIVYRSYPCGLASSDGSVYVTDSSSVRKVNPLTGGLTTPAGTGEAGPLGDGHPATRASFNAVCGAAVDRSGNLVFADQGNSRIRVAAASSGTFYGRAMTAGDIYTVAGTGTRGFAGEGGPAVKARLNDPQQVAVDGAGNLVIADSGNFRIRVVAAHTRTFYGQPMTAGDIYTVAGGQDGFGGDGGPALGAAFNNAGSVAVDGAGNLLIADSFNDRVRVVAESTGSFYGKPMTAGDIYTVAGNGKDGFAGDGGPAAGAELSGPAAVAADGTGGLLIADTGNSRIREVTDRGAPARPGLGGV